MRGVAILTFAVLHVLQLVLLAVLVKDYHFVDPALYDTIKTQDGRDVLYVASQLGRFDLVSLFLGAGGLFLGAAALGGFWMVRSAAVSAADAAAREESNTLVPKLAREWFEREGRAIFEQAAAINQGAKTATIDIDETEAQQVIKAANEIGEV
jgi:hypothetical protein